MPTIQILLSVTKDVGTDTDDGPGPRHRFVFTNDLALERYDDSTPGSGLPVDPLQRRAGTHSGVVTLVRVADATDDFFPDGSELWAYDATYKFNTLDDTPLQKGQVTARGVVLFQGEDAWIYQFRLRSLVARAPTPQLIERSLRVFQTPKQAARYRAVIHPAWLRKSFCVEDDSVTAYRDP
jgi:hypothetical protein